jgi:hypothetical protein
MAFAYQQAETQSGLFFRQAETFGDDAFMRAKFKDGMPCKEWTEPPGGKPLRKPVAWEPD